MPAATPPSPRDLWEAGDYARTAVRLQPVARRAVEALGDVRGEEVLDIATGTGNAALIAARRGARAVGIDLTPGLLSVARERARSEGLRDTTWVVGDAQDLPCADDSFDAVVSVFGMKFAPDHERAAAELARVLRPAGRAVLTAWLPEGPLAAFGAAAARHLPPAPPTPSPALWAREDHVRSLLEPHGLHVTVRRETLAFTAPSVEAFFAEQEEVHGLVALARRALGDGYRALRDELRAILRDGNEAADGSFLVTSPYVLVRALGTP